MAFSVAELFYQWESIGVFEFILPFLILFAIIFGVLSTTNILGHNRGVHLIIALAIALLALRVGYVQAFFLEFFPRFGIGLVLLVALVILAGLFIIPEHIKGWYIGFAALGLVIGVAVTIGAFDQFGWFGSYFWQEYWGNIVAGIIIIALLASVFASAKPKSPEKGITIPLGPLRKGFE